MPRRRASPDSGAAATVQRTLNETKPGLDQHNLRVRQYDRCYEIWRSPHNPREREGRPRWKPLLKAKYAMQSIDQATVAIAQGVPTPRCTPRNEASVEKAKAMEQILAYYSDVSHVADQQSPVIQQALVYGVSPAKTSWCYKEADRGMLVPAVDEQSGRVLWQPTQQRIVEADWPEMQAWDVYDCWWDPFARDPDAAAYVVLRCWPSKDELLKRAYDEQANPYGMYRNLDLLFASGPGAERPQTAQNQILDTGTTTVTYRDRFEIWEVWRDDSLTVIGNRQVQLYHGSKPYWMPGKPVSISVARPDFFRMEGISETEIIDDIQQNLQAQDNLRLENMRFTVNRGATVRETVPDRASLVVQPHFLWFVGDHDDVHFVDQPALPPEAYEEHSVLLALMQQTTGINDYNTGGTGAGVDQSTATGVSLLSSQASRLLVYKAELISRRTWLRTFQQWADLTRQFLRSSVEVPVRGPGAEIIDWVKAGPAEVYGDYDVKIEAAEESLNRNQRRSDLVALSNTLAPYAQAGMVDVKPLLKEIADAFGFPHPEALFPPQQQAQLAAPSGGGLNNGGTFPQGPPPLTAGGAGGAQMLVPHPLASILRGNQ